MDRKKLVFKRETVKSLTSGELARARGAGTTKGESGYCTASNSGCSTVVATHCGETTMDFACRHTNVSCNSQESRCW